MLQVKHELSFLSLYCCHRQDTFFLRQKNHKMSNILTWSSKAPTELFEVCLFILQQGWLGSLGLVRKGCLAGHCQRKRIVFNNNSHFSSFYLPPPCKCLKSLWFCSGEDNGIFSSIMKTSSFRLVLTFPTTLCSENLGSVQMYQQRSWFSEGLEYTSLETTLLIPFSPSLLPSSAWPWAELQGREKHKKRWKEKCLMSQERESNYFYRTLLNSLEKCGSLKNAQEQVQRQLKISHCQSEV